VALNHPGWEAVLDDHSARREARLGIPCIGTVGLVLTGHRLGIVPSVPDALQTLREAGMYISDGLFRRVQTVWLRAWHVHAASGN
jgi:predicted nucleic acid-binding protein